MVSQSRMHQEKRIGGSRTTVPTVRHIFTFRWIGGTRVWSLVVSDKSSLAGVNPSTLAKYYHFELQLKNWAGQKIVVEKFTFGQNGRFYRHIIKNGFISIIEAEEHCKRNDLDCHFKLGTTVPNFVKMIDSY